MIYKKKCNKSIIWFHRDINKSNRYCLYCGIDLFEENIESNKEHLISRNFVPKNSFSDSSAFNFIFRACKKCNDEKGVFDRHISSITLVSSSACADDPVALNSAKRKLANDYHPKKSGTLIKDASENLKISSKLSAYSDISINFVSPPQMDVNYAEMLAYRHIQGFFSLVCSRNPTEAIGTRLLAHQNFRVFGIYKESDWGNPQLLDVIKWSENMTCYINLNTANGYFKAIMKRDDVDNTGWFWALEWNKSYRIAGWLSSANVTPKMFQSLPDLQWEHLSSELRIRTEVPLLPEGDDVLFSQAVEVK